MVTNAGGTDGTIIKYHPSGHIDGTSPGKSSLELAKRLGGAVKPLCRRV